MSSPLPASHLPGAIATMNSTGFMLEHLDDYAEAFARDAASRNPQECLDIGCAYGVATLRALQLGARICACDMEPRHLEVLRERTPSDQLARLRTATGTLPQVGFPAGSFAAVLASRVLHFLDGPDLRSALRQMHDWLIPGGRLYLVADSPWMPSWRANLPAYEAALERGEDWPGMIADFAPFRQPGTTGPAFLNTLDPQTLARECSAAGFEVLRADWFAMHRLGAESNGREHAGCIAVRAG